MIASGQEIMIAGCATAAVLLLIAVWMMLHRVHATAIRVKADLRSELEAKHADCCAQISQLADNLAILEMSAQQVDAAKGGLNRSMRSQAMQLLRSGMSAENAATSLGVSRNEMRLIAAVSRTLRI